MVTEIAVLFTYMTVLYCGSMIVPGVGLAGHLLVLIPWSLLDWAHVPAYGLLAWMAARWLERQGWPLAYALAVGCLGAFVFGLWTEVFQGMVPGRQSSSDDLLRNALGIGAAAAISMFRRTWWSSGLRTQLLWQHLTSPR
jgi:hypothetical protein